MCDSTHGIEASQEHDDKEKREERREKSEERREKKEEKRDPKRGRQRSPNERGANPFLGHPAPSWDLWRLRGQRQESREKREESRKIKTRVFLVFSLSAEGVFPKDSVSLFPS